MDVLLVNPDQSLNYLSAEYFKSEVVRVMNEEYQEVEHVIIDGLAINYSIDVTVVKVGSACVNFLQLLLYF